MLSKLYAREVILVGYYGAGVVRQAAGPGSVLVGALGCGTILTCQMLITQMQRGTIQLDIR